MVTAESVEKQLKRVHFNTLGWGRTEAKELPHILMPGEEIYELVNGIYEGGFALLVATNVRMLLIDKKPMNYLTVEDLRFDMISEIDYGRRLMGARISISTGSKNLKFTSYNQQRLRKLITHVQHCMAETKQKDSAHQEDQKQHLEQINQQLQVYLLAQHQNQQKLQNALEKNQGPADVDVTPIRPDPELSDYLFAQSLLMQNQATQGQADMQALELAKSAQWTAPLPAAPVSASPMQASSQKAADELYAEGVQEIFGNRSQQVVAPAEPIAEQPIAAPVAPQPASTTSSLLSFDVNPLKIAYSKLPMALRNRKFGRPSFHAHSESEIVPAQPAARAI